MWKRLCGIQRTTRAVHDRVVHAERNDSVDDGVQKTLTHVGPPYEGSTAFAIPISASGKTAEQLNSSEAKINNRNRLKGKCEVHDSFTTA